MKTSLPTDNETEKWFEENIENGNVTCSASSAIYKFRLWLRERESSTTPTPENTEKPIERYSEHLVYPRHDDDDHDIEFSVNQEHGDWVKYKDHLSSYKRLKGDYDAAYSDLQAVRKVSHDRKKSIETLKAENEQKEKRIQELEAALSKVAKWETPETGKFWNERTKDSPMSYEAAYGSNGVRDYFKAVAGAALTPKQ